MIKTGISINKIYIISIFLFLFLNLQCQEKKMMLDVTKAELKVTDCGIFYKGKELKLSNIVEDWEKIVNTSFTREVKGFLIYDDLGIAILPEWDSEKNSYRADYDSPEFARTLKIKEFYIFFTNLESEEGKQGKLDFAVGRRSYEDIEKEYHSINKSISKELEKEIKADIKPAKNFVYPYTVFSGVLDLQGAPLQSGMPLKEMNQYREKQGLSIISFRDDNMNGWDESGTLTGDNGNYFTIGRKICPEGNAWLFIIRFTDYKPEYLQVLLQEEHEREYHYDKNGNKYK